MDDGTRLSLVFEPHDDDEYEQDEAGAPKKKKKKKKGGGKAPAPRTAAPAIRSVKPAPASTRSTSTPATAPRTTTVTTRTRSFKPTGGIVGRRFVRKHGADTGRAGSVDAADPNEENALLVAPPPAGTSTYAFAGHLGEDGVFTALEPTSIITVNGKKTTAIGRMPAGLIMNHLYRLGGPPSFVVGEDLGEQVPEDEQEEQRLNNQAPLKLAPSTATEIGGFTAVQIAALRADQVAALTPAQVAALRADQVGALNATHISALTSSQIAALGLAPLRIDQIVGLRPDQIGGLTPAQIGMLRSDQLIALTPAQRAALTPAQRTGLTPAQAASLGLLAPAVPLAPAVAPALAPAPAVPQAAPPPDPSLVPADAGAPALGESGALGQRGKTNVQAQVVGGTPVVLPSGTEVRFVSSKGSKTLVRFDGGQGWIPSLAIHWDWLEPTEGAWSTPDDDVVERFSWTLQFDPTQREGSLVRLPDDGFALRFTGVDGRPRQVPVDVSYQAQQVPAGGEPPGLERLATVPAEVGLATRVLWGWVAAKRRAIGTVIPFGVDGVTYAARLEKHWNAPVGLSVYRVIAGRRR